MRCSKASPSPLLPARRYALATEISAAQSCLEALGAQQINASSDDGSLFAGAETCAFPLDYYVKGVIPADSIIAIYGATTVGKTFWATDALWHIATEKPYCGRKVKRAPVLYIGLEGRAGIPNRMKALARQHGEQEAWFAALTLPVSLGSAAEHAADEALIIEKARAVAQRYDQSVGCEHVVNLGYRRRTGALKKAFQVQVAQHCMASLPLDRKSRRIP